jgi:hypothetical protein
MERQEAFVRALVLVGIPIVVVWTVLFSLSPYRLEFLPYYALAALITLVILLPFAYLRYRKLSDPTGIRNKKEYIYLGILCFLASAQQLVGVTHPRSRWDFLISLACIVLFSAMGTRYLFLAAKAKKTALT